MEVIKRQPKQIILAALARMGEHAPAYIYLAFPFAAAIIYRTLARTITIPMCRQMRRQSATSLTCSISIRGMTTRRRSVINLSELSPPWSSRLTLLCCAWSDNTLCAQRANYDMAARLLARVAGDVDQNLRRLCPPYTLRARHLAALPGSFGGSYFYEGSTFRIRLPPPTSPSEQGSSDAVSQVAGCGTGPAFGTREWDELGTTLV